MDKPEQKKITIKLTIGREKTTVEADGKLYGDESITDAIITKPGGYPNGHQ